VGIHNVLMRPNILVYIIPAHQDIGFEIYAIQWGTMPCSIDPSLGLSHGSPPGNLYPTMISLTILLNFSSTAMNSEFHQV
jgi:hypothetical protein